LSRHTFRKPGGANLNNTAYCAFLRGVNVNSRRMKMANVCGIFRVAGRADVTSLLASGNIVFHSACPQNGLRSLLESTLTEHYNEPIYSSRAPMTSAASSTAHRSQRIRSFIFTPSFVRWSSKTRFSPNFLKSRPSPAKTRSSTTAIPIDNSPKARRSTRVFQNFWCTKQCGTNSQAVISERSKK